MAYIIRVTLEPCYVVNGAGPVQTGQLQGNEPGFGAAQGPGPVPAAQTMMLMIAESVPGGDSPSAANFTTAINQAATDLETMLATAGAAPGYGAGTPLSIIAGWSTGNP